MAFHWFFASSLAIVSVETSASSFSFEIASGLVCGELMLVAYRSGDPRNLSPTNTQT